MLIVVRAMCAGRIFGETRAITLTKKSVPYAKAYTMQMLNTTFDLKTTRHDDRNDDIYLQDPKDAEEPLLPA